MVYESEFSRKNFLNSCAQSGVFHTSSDYKPPTASTPSYLSTRSRSANTPSGTASIGNGSADVTGRAQYRSRFSPSPQPQYETSRVRGEYAPSAYGDEDQPRRVQYCTCCKNCCGGNYRGAAFIPGNFMNSADDMGAYLKKRTSRSGIRLRDSEESAASARPMYSVRNVPVRSLDELREAVAIRRNYVKERKGLFHETGSMYAGSTPDREASPSLHPAESIRSSRRSSVSPSPIPASSELKAESSNGAGVEN